MNSPRVHASNHPNHAMFILLLLSLLTTSQALAQGLTEEEITNLADQQELKTALVSVIKSDVESGYAVTFELAEFDAKRFVNANLKSDVNGFYVLPKPDPSSCTFNSTESFSCTKSLSYPILFGTIPNTLYPDKTLFFSSVLKKVQKLSDIPDERFTNTWATFITELQTKAIQDEYHLEGLGFFSIPNPEYDAWGISFHQELSSVKRAKGRETREGELPPEEPEIVLPEGYHITGCTFTNGKFVQDGTDEMNCGLGKGLQGIALINMKWVDSCPFKIRVTRELGFLEYQFHPPIYDDPASLAGSKGCPLTYQFQYNFTVEFGYPNEDYCGIMRGGPCSKTIGAKVGLNTCGNIYIPGCTGGIILNVCNPAEGEFIYGEGLCTDKITIDLADYLNKADRHLVMAREFADILREYGENEPFTSPFGAVFSSNFGIESANDEERMALYTAMLGEELQTKVSSMLDGIAEGTSGIGDIDFTIQDWDKMITDIGKTMFDIDDVTITSTGNIGFYNAEIGFLKPEDMVWNLGTTVGGGIMTTFSLPGMAVSGTLDFSGFKSEDQDLVYKYWGQSGAGQAPSDLTALALANEEAAYNELVKLLAENVVNTMTPNEWFAFGAATVSAINKAEWLKETLKRLKEARYETFSSPQNPGAYYKGLYGKEEEKVDEIGRMKRLEQEKKYDVFFAKTQEELHTIDNATEEIADLEESFRLQGISEFSVGLDDEIQRYKYFKQTIEELKSQIGVNESPTNAKFYPETADYLKTRLDSHTQAIKEIKEKYNSLAQSRKVYYAASQNLAKECWRYGLPNPMGTNFKYMEMWSEAKLNQAFPGSVEDSAFQLPENFLLPGTSPKVKAEWLKTAYRNFIATTETSYAFSKFKNISDSDKIYLANKIQEIKLLKHNRIEPSPVLAKFYGEKLDHLTALREQTIHEMAMNRIKIGEMLKEIDDLSVAMAKSNSELYLQNRNRARELNQWLIGKIIGKDEFNTLQNTVETEKGQILAGTAENRARKRGIEYLSAVTQNLAVKYDMDSKSLERLNMDIVGLGGVDNFHIQPDPNIYTATAQDVENFARIPNPRTKAILKWPVEQHFYVEFLNEQTIPYQINDVIHQEFTAIVGSRTLPNMSEALDKFMLHVDPNYFNCTGCVVTGGATGADTLAMEIARETGFPVWTFPAQWDKFGKAAGPLRNGKIVERADQIIAIGQAGIQTPGTINTISQAIDAGKPVMFFDVTTGAFFPITQKRWPTAQEVAGWLTQHPR